MIKKWLMSGVKELQFRVCQPGSCLDQIRKNSIPAVWIPGCLQLVIPDKCRKDKGRFGC